MGTKWEKCDKDYILDTSTKNFEIVFQGKTGILCNLNIEPNLPNDKNPVIFIFALFTFSVQI